MQCPECGSIEADAATVCGSCGSSLGLPAFKTPTSVDLTDEDDTGVTRLLGASRDSPDEPITKVPEARHDSDDESTSVSPSGQAPPPRPPPTPAADAITMAPVATTARTRGTAKRPTPVATKAGETGEGESVDTGPLAIGQQFGRYTIIRVLGIGGMGAVYQAWDEELEVPVALKVIRPEVAADDPTAARQLEQRFKRELLLARQVTHRNVVRIHDLGAIEGIKYITMSYVQGVDLQTILREKGPLPVRQVLRILRGVVAGLEAAHAAGVVHRDLKPANIMVEHKTGDALIMDFGIARLAGTEGDEPKSAPGAFDTDFGTPSALTGATMAGTVVGTVAYMAPEQARAEDVDGRADIYSLGLIVYDMLVDRKHFESGAKPVQELMKRQAEAPPSVRSFNSEIPEPFDALVMRTLQPKREDRQADIRELASELARLDENGFLLPTIRRLTGRMIATAAALLVALAAATWWYVQSLLPEATHDPVSVVIADIQNTTGDAAFDGALAPILKLALEEAEFVSAYDRLGIRRTLGLPPPDVLNEASARQLAANQGVGVVLSGTLSHQGNGYELSMKAAEAVTGNVIADLRGRASSRDRVLAVATSLAIDVRRALGDDTSDTARRFATDTLSTTSLEVVRHYAAAMEALSDNRFPDALESFSKALEGDPDFGLAYVGMASSSRNMGRQQDAEKYAAEAVRHVGRMTERERYRTRGLAFMANGDYHQCLKEFNDMLARYAADVVAYNNLAFCQTQLRDMPSALAAIRRVAEILPKRALYRLNLALYAAYGGDFQTAAAEARTTQELGSPLGLLPLAYAQLGQGQVSEAIAAYKTLAQVNAQGASFAASGLGDLAVYEGRFSDALRIFGEGAAADLENMSFDRAAAKLIGVAHAQLLRKRREAAITAANEALQHTRAVRIRFLAARVFIEAGQIDRAQEIASDLAAETQAEPRAYAKIIEGRAALENGDARQAIAALEDANGILDTWMGRFELGRAYLESDMLVQADSQFDGCLKRRGDLDEEPMYGYVPAAHYYLGRVREAGDSIGFADSYRAYLDIRGKAGEDPLLQDVRRRAGL